MKRSQAATEPPERIRYRLTPLQRVLPVLPSFGIFLMLQIQFWLRGWPFSRIETGALIFMAVAPLLGLITSRSLGVTLTPSAAVVHNFRRRSIPWSDIQLIRIEPYYGTRTVVIYEVGGRSTRLRAPSTGALSWDGSFEAKFHTIGGWWLTHRGPGWVPVTPPPTWWNGPRPSDGNPYAPPA